MVKQRLAQEQPVAYQTLAHALQTNKLAHAYLFHGPKGSGKLACALLLAQSLICAHRDKDGFACEQCAECIRVKTHSFADMRILDGTQISIKKEDVLKLRQAFHKTGLEHTGKRVYIVKCAENATPDALNSLLKFLEEPSGDIYAILLSEQPDRLLPTIVSRCQPIRFRALRRAACYASAKAQLPCLDAYLLSAMIQNPERMREVHESDEYQHAFYLFQQFQSAFHESPYEALAMLLKEGVDGKKRDGKQCMRYFLEMQMTLYRDLIRGNTLCEDSTYQAMLHTAQQRNFPYPVFLEILLETRDKLWKSVNLTLLCDQMIHRMKEAC